MIVNYIENPNLGHVNKLITLYCTTRKRNQLNIFIRKITASFLPYALTCKKELEWDIHNQLPLSIQGVDFEHMHKT